MQHAAALRLRAMVNLVREEELAALLPERIAGVEIELADATSLTQPVAAVNPKRGS
jgi:hypothetical protein